LRFAHEIESTPLDHCGLAAEAIRSEENRCTEDALKRANQAAILFPSSVQPKLSSISAAVRNRIV